MRAYTGREKLLKFSGCYHGHAGKAISCGTSYQVYGSEPSWELNNMPTSSWHFYVLVIVKTQS